MIRFWISGIALVFAMNGVLFAQPAPQPPASYFTVIKGDVPILLTAPHGGTLSYPFSPRSCTDGQTCSSDVNTRLLAPRASDDFFALTGKRPYVVIAQGDRKFIDLNRDNSGGTPNDAYEDPLAEPYYNFYHDTIQGFINDIRAEFGRGLLLDIHGQSTVPDAILRGTKNGLTTTEVLGKVGPASLNGPNSIFGSLDELGYSVDPNVATPFLSQVENPSFNGGFTVQNYGSHQSTGIDAIQIEFGIDFRGGSGDSEWIQTAADLAIAMNNYHEAYLVAEPGDFDGDGTVDSDDLLVWQNGFGQFSGNAARTAGDADGDGLVSGNDFLLWQRNFDNGVVGLAAVPEPSTLFLLSIGLNLCLSRSGSRRKARGGR